MKQIKHKIHINIFAVLIIFLISGCDNMFENPIKNKDTGEDISLLLIDPYVFDTKLILHFIDENTGSYVDSNEIIFAFTGNDAQYIVDAGGTHRVYSLTKTGKAEIFIDPNREPSKSSPLQLTLFCDDTEYGYDAFPIKLTYTGTGQHNVIVRMINTNDNEMSDAPFELRYNNTIINDENPDWDVLSKKVIQNGKNYYRIYRINDPLSGILSLTEPEQSFESWGIEGYLVNANEEYSIIELTNQASELPDNALQFKAYMTTSNNNYIECINGINVEISNENKLNGTASFYYQILSGKEIVKDGFISASQMPQDINTGSFYYPTDNNGLTLKVFGDEQYIINKSSYSLSNNICEETISVSVSPKAGLTPFNVAISFYCPGNFLGIAPSASGTFSEKGIERVYNRFSFTEGVSTLYLKPDKTYNIEATITGQDMSFDFPTNPEDISDVIENASYKNNEIEYIDYDITENENGINTIKIKVYFKEGECPF
ncbi:MAG: hypothetical protein PF436_12475 [Prolixibacteraceae bacterium]|jgi:hypothetical protein|nr:hypothetical protein [Prolixibacteraceae bacterium]